MHVTIFGTGYVGLVTGTCLAEVGNNKGCMALKGANRSHTGEPEADHWGLNPDLEAVGKR